MSLGRWLLLFCFFLSGATGLVYEVAWTRSLTLLFGSTPFAVSTILAAFMAGLGTGALAVGRLVERWSHALRAYALLELGIGASAFALPLVLPGLVPLYRAVWESVHPSFWTLSLLRFAILFLLLLVPTMFMGGTLPALVKYFARTESSLGREAGLLYGLNTLGAVLGAGAAGFVLLPWLGLRNTTMSAAALNLAIGAVVLALSRTEASPERALGPTRHRVDRPVMGRDSGVLVVFALSGFVALVAEVAWTRGLTLVLGSSTYAFTIMLVTFLIGLAAGSLVMARALARNPDLVLTLALLQAGIGLASLLGAHLFGDLPLFYLYLFKAVSGFTLVLVAGQFALAGLIMLGPALLMGAVFPVVIQLLRSPGLGAGEQVGLAYAANTVGAVLGAFTAGFVLIPKMGIANTLTLGVALSLGAALGVPLASGQRLRRASVVGALLVALPVLAPRWEALTMSSGVYKEAPLYLSLYSSPHGVFTRLFPQFRLLYYHEGPTATVTVTERPSLEEHRHLALAIDGKVDASTAGDMPTQILSGHIPLLLHPRPEKVLVIGLASGVTVGAVTRHPVRQITAVEIEPAVVEASRLFRPFNHHPLEDPRVRLVVNDARNYLLLSRDRYDVIVSEPSNPWLSGPAKLFTREFFKLGRDRLRPEGLFVQWLQLYGMTETSLRALLRTFQSVFPHLLVFQPNVGDLLLVGGVEPVRGPVPQIQERMRVAAVAGDLGRVGVSDVFDLLTRFRLGDTEVRAYAGEGPLNTDDNALIEFSAPREIYLDTAAQNSEALAAAGKGIARYVDGAWRSARDRAGFLAALGSRALATRDWNQAEVTARHSLAAAVSAQGLWVLGEALEHQRRETEAVRLWNAALAIHPHYVPALMSLALYHQERGEPQQAQPFLESLSVRTPNDPTVNFLLGASRYELGLYQEALAFLAHAVNTPMDHASAAGRRAAYFWGDGLGVEPLAWYYLHLVHGRLGNRRAAEEAWTHFLQELDHWRQTLERRPPDPATFSLLENVHLRSERGVHLPEDAHLSEVLARRVVEPLTRYYKGVTAYLLGYPEVARAELEAVVTQLGSAGSLSHARYYVGLADWKLGRLTQARLHLEGFLEHLEGGDRQSLAAAEATRTLAAIYAAQGQREQSAEFGQEAELILRAIEAR